MREDKKLDLAIAAIVDDIENLMYKDANEFREDARAVSKGHGVSYGKVISLIEAELKRVNCE